MSPVVGIKRQLEPTPGFGRKGKSEKPEPEEGNRNFGVKRDQYMKVKVN